MLLSPNEISIAFLNAVDEYLKSNNARVTIAGSVNDDGTHNPGSDFGEYDRAASAVSKQWDAHASVTARADLMRRMQAINYLVRNGASRRAAFAVKIYLMSGVVREHLDAETNELVSRPIFESRPVHTRHDPNNLD